jgi:leucyl aminopeptidase
MEYNIKVSEPSSARTACLVLPVFSNSQLSPVLKDLDDKTAGLVKKLLKKGDLKSTEAGQTLMVYDLPGVTAERVMFLACGSEKDFDGKKFATATASAVKQLDQSNALDATFVLPEFNDKESAYKLTRILVTAAESGVYQFNECKSDPNINKRPLKKISLLLLDNKLKKTVEKAVAHGQAIGHGETLAKNLANLPGNICTPSYLADQAVGLKRGVKNLKVSVLEESDMEKLGMGALLSVSRGSRQPAKLIVMEYKGAEAGSKPVVLVGKGLTFDAGGISIKPAANMDEMKYDMCGGASVLGAMQACIELALPLNVIGIVPSSENLPDGDANKPGDIVTSMSGQTIEILNTDAEGRLILCDALTYCGKFDPDVVIDIATLTGACVVALGKHASGLLANDDKLADELVKAGTESGDRVWQLPLWDDYQPQLDSNFADMANIGGPQAGTITAACFLSRYTKKYKWAHLDIAGTAWLSGGKEKGATGRPVSLLTHYLLKRARQI